MSLVSGMQLDPDMVATALEIYPDTEEAKVRCSFLLQQAKRSKLNPSILFNCCFGRL